MVKGVFTNHEHCNCIQWWGDHFKIVKKWRRKFIFKAEKTVSLAHIFHPLAFNSFKSIWTWASKFRDNEADPRNLNEPKSAAIKIPIPQKIGNVSGFSALLRFFCSVSFDFTQVAKLATNFYDLWTGKVKICLSLVNLFFCDYWQIPLKVPNVKFLMYPKLNTQGQNFHGSVPLN